MHNAGMQNAGIRPDTMFRLRAVRKRYGEALAVDGVDLEIQSGRCTVLLGPSGCGKSTILRLLNGLLTPSEGGVEFAGEPVGRQGEAGLRSLRRRIGYVIQDGGLFPHLTVRQNVGLAAREGDDTPAAVDTRLGELAELTHLDPSLFDRYPGQLSGGQKQRVALVRALFLDPDALLLDEPLGALDPMIRSELQEELRALIRSLRKTVVMVTHDLAEAAHFGDHVVLLRAGRVVQQGAFRELIEAPASDFVADFVNAQRQLHEVDA
jgi:osmoprotectant transport system ATP-binding protein